MNERDLSELWLQGLSLDSRRVKPGDCFIALSGLVDDGKRYIPEAIAKGAVAILLESGTDLANRSQADQVPIIPYSNLRNSISAIAGRFYADPSKQLNLIAITGTNGKTSVSHFIAQILGFFHHPCAVMGTLGNGFLDKLNPGHQSCPSINMTTLDPISVQEVLASLKKQGAEIVAMEVTSHALTQGRVEGLQIKTAIFTNLTRDHLDYHQNMQNYFAAKKRLFTELKPKNIIINIEDEYGRLLLEEILDNAGRDQNILFSKIIAYGTSINSHSSISPEMIRKWQNSGVEFVLAKDLSFSEAGIKASLETPWGTGDFLCPLLGQFNLSNILAALTAVFLEKTDFEHRATAIKNDDFSTIVPFQMVLTSLNNLKTVPGRMVSFRDNPKKPTVVIDYAHTPDALSQVLQALRLHCRGKLWCVFGCGGDRDRGKRPQMAAVAEGLSDKVIVTQDNPRTENPDIILSEIMQGFKFANNIMIESSRKEAIRFAIRSAVAEDIVLIAGKGHEDYQIIGVEKIPFSDQIEVIQALSLTPLNRSSP